MKNNKKGKHKVVKEKKRKKCHTCGWVTAKVQIHGHSPIKNSVSGDIMVSLVGVERGVYTPPTPPSLYDERGKELKNTSHPIDL